MPPTSPPSRAIASTASLVCRGHDYGASYFEVYEVDLLSVAPGVQAAVSAVRDPTLCW